MYDVRFAQALCAIGIFDLCLEVKCFRLSLAHCEIKTHFISKFDGFDIYFLHVNTFINVFLFSSPEEPR